MKQLDEIIINVIESLRNNQKQLSENTPVTMQKLKERLTILLDKEKLLGKRHKMQKNDNLFPQTNSITKNTYHKQKIKTNFETNILEKLKGYAKIDTFDTFYQSFLEI